MERHGRSLGRSWRVFNRTTKPASIISASPGSIKAGEAEKARSSLKRALELRPDFPDAAEARKALLSLGG